ncbi:MAG: hypothetical protein M3441_22895 [Chloroflexota bacterium]|jgi:hypothetical protein|nr:hypothetical protein [Chloroflexota bacterium]
MATEVEVMGERLLRGFNEEALGNTETAVVAAEAARRAGFDHGSEDYEAALSYLLDSGYLRPAAVVGGEGYSITVVGVEKLARE